MTGLPDNNSRAVVSNQDGIHPNLEKLLMRHKSSAFKRPISRYFREQEGQVSDFLGAGPFVLDIGCGVGESTAKLAQSTTVPVLGVDQSELRVGKCAPLPAHAAVRRLDAVDLWQWLAEKALCADFQMIAYPNPWPKSVHVQRRWHGHAIWPAVLSAAREHEIRSNWSIYLQEAQFAAELYGWNAECTQIELDAVETESFTPFERKYLASGQTCWKLRLWR